MGPSSCLPVIVLSAEDSQLYLPDTVVTNLRLRRWWHTWYKMKAISGYFLTKYFYSTDTISNLSIHYGTMHGPVRLIQKTHSHLTCRNLHIQKAPRMQRSASSVLPKCRMNTTLTWMRVQIVDSRDTLFHPLQKDGQRSDILRSLLFEQLYFLSGLGVPVSYRWILTRFSISSETCKNSRDSGLVVPGSNTSCLIW